VKPLLADTGGLLRALARNDKGVATWPDFADALTHASAVVVPALVLAEVDYFLRAEREAMRQLVAELLDPSTTYELEQVLPEDIARAMTFDAKFRELELGLVDGMVAAIAERRRISRILTADRRDFTAIRIGARFDKRVELVP
jgi:predicted nucleic acid-binding protein